MDGIIDALREAGIAADMRFTISSRSYRRSSRGFRRCLLRLRMYGCYPLYLFCTLLTSKFNALYVVCTSRFFAPLLAACAIRLKNRLLFFKKPSHVIHLVYDLFPEALIATGHLSSDTFFARSLRRLTRMTFHCCATNVFIGQHLLTYAAQDYGTIPQAQVIPVGADERTFVQPPIQTAASQRAIQILYCGNLGHLHDSATLIAVLTDTTWMPKRPLTFQFQTSGVNYACLRKALTDCKPQARVTLIWRADLDDSEWTTQIRQADIALVTLVPGAEKVGMPSKVYSALVAGQAILATCPLQSDLADLVRQHACGWVVAPGDTTTLKNVLYTISSDSASVTAKRNCAFESGHRYYAAKIIAGRWRDLLQRQRH